MINRKAIISAGSFLSDQDVSLEKQLQHIIKAKDSKPDMLVDYVHDDVQVAAFAQLRFTVSEFIEMIPLTEGDVNIISDDDILKMYKDHDETHGESVGKDIITIRNSSHYSNSEKVREILVVLATACLLEGDMNAFNTDLIDFVDYA